MKTIKLKLFYSVKTGITPLGIGALSLLALALMFLYPMIGVAVGASIPFVANVLTPEQMHEKEMAAIKTMTDHLEKVQKEVNEKIAGKVNKDELSSLQGFQTQVQTALDELKAALAAEEEAGEEVEESVKRIEAAVKAVNDTQAALQTKMTELVEDVAAQKNGKNKSKRGAWVTSEEIAKFIKDTFGEDKQSKSKEITTLGMEFFPTIRRKAAEDFLIPTFFEGGPNTDSTVFTGRVIDPTLYQRKRKKNIILDYFDIQTINAPALLYMEKVETSGPFNSSAETGGADWIVSGATKPKRSFRVTTGKVEAKKVAIFGTVADELLMDIPSLENWIREDFTDEIKEAYNDALLNNDPASDPNAPLGLKENAIQFDPTAAFTNTIPAPNYIDMIVAAAAQMANLKEQAATAFVASDVYYAILILKDSQTRYMENSKVYTNQLGQLFIGGIEIVGVDEEDVPSTHILMIGVDVGFKIRNYGPLVFERGHNGNDFREDKTSYRGYQRVLSYIPTHRENSVLYDTWTNIEAGIIQTS